MPIQECTLPNGEKGYRWGKQGKCYPDRKDAEKQAEAAHANGYVGDAIALDQSARVIDADGRLHVKKSHISKANVCPYYGKEIPGWDSMGLDPDKVYNLFRPPEELEKAVPTFARIPILSEHVPISSSEIPKDKIIGSIGSEVSFDSQYLDADLCFWVDDAIAGIESAQVKELSCAYRYIPVMESGEYKGQPYDGRMTEIQGNHLALVEVGRAGSDVVVADSNPFTYKEITMKMSKLGKAIFATLCQMSPTLAKDESLPKLVGNLTRKTAKKDELKKGIVAMDAMIDSQKLDDVLDALIDIDDNPEPSETVTEDETPSGKIRSMLEGKVDAETIDAICAMVAAPAADEDPDDKKDDKKDEEDKKAMDSAIKKATDKATSELRAQLKDAEDAKRDVRPVVGDVIGMDTAEEVYAFALDQMKIDHKGVEGGAALRAIYRAAKSTMVHPTPAPIAQDSDAMTKKFPAAGRFKIA
jgi:hypothetical protein